MRPWERIKNDFNGSFDGKNRCLLIVIDKYDPPPPLNFDTHNTSTLEAPADGDSNFLEPENVRISTRYLEGAIYRMQYSKHIYI